MNNLKTTRSDTKKVFWKKGTCSRTFFYLLNREFGYPKELEECASDPFAGGVLRKGHQCGMVWGASLAVGAESFRQYQDTNKSIGLAIKVTQQLVTSFTKRTHTVDCRDITGTDFSKKWQMAKYLLFKAKPCFDLADRWAPEAIQSALKELSEQADLPRNSISCASEVAQKMGASDEEMAMAAGFAGGLGLSGHACGGLGAAIWMRSLSWSREHSGESAESNPAAKQVYETFCSETGSETLCCNISGQHFQNVEEHTTFIKNGGCKGIINVLAKS